MAILVLDDQYVTAAHNRRHGDFRSQEFVDALRAAGKPVVAFDGVDPNGEAILDAEDCANAALMTVIEELGNDPHLTIDLLLDLTWWEDPNFGFDLAAALDAADGCIVRDVLVVSVYAGQYDEDVERRLRARLPRLRNVVVLDYARTNAEAVVSFFE